MEDQEIKSVPCENCPKGVPEGKQFVGDDGKVYCCGKCAATGKQDNTCQFC
jgi:hypothetical protein